MFGVHDRPMRSIRALLFVLACGGITSGSAWASGADHLLCHLATSEAEHDTGVPDQLLSAISRVESGRTDPETGRMEAWPWSINVEGVGHVYPDRAAAVAAVRAYQAEGRRSIDIGCMQINLQQHPEAFASLEDAFDPRSNAAFAARFLRQLFVQTGSWPHAAAAYHSQTPELGRDYQTQVLAQWAEGDGPVAAGEPGPHRAGPSPSRAWPAIAASTPPASVSPFGPHATSFAASAPPASVRAIAYGPTATVRSLSSAGRGLAAYRLMPIAMSGRPMVASQF